MDGEYKSNDKRMKRETNKAATDREREKEIKTERNEQKKHVFLCSNCVCLRTVVRVRNISMFRPTK